MRDLRHWRGELLDSTYHQPVPDMADLDESAVVGTGPLAPVTAWGELGVSDDLWRQMQANGISTVRYSALLARVLRLNRRRRRGWSDWGVQMRMMGRW